MKKYTIIIVLFLIIPANHAFSLITDHQYMRIDWDEPWHNTREYTQYKMREIKSGEYEIQLRSRHTIPTLQKENSFSESRDFDISTMLYHDEGNDLLIIQLPILQKSAPVSRMMVKKFLKAGFNTAIWFRPPEPWVESPTDSGRSLIRYIAQDQQNAELVLEHFITFVQEVVHFPLFRHKRIALAGYSNGAILISAALPYLPEDIPIYIVTGGDILEVLKSSVEISWQDAFKEFDVDTSAYFSHWRTLPLKPLNTAAQIKNPERIRAILAVNDKSVPEHEFRKWAKLANINLRVLPSSYSSYLFDWLMKDGGTGDVGGQIQNGHYWLAFEVFLNDALEKDIMDFFYRQFTR